MALTRETIRRVQAALKREGFDPGPVDGVLGPRTTDAVRRYQLAHRMTAPQGGPIRWPGTVGPSTLAALGLTPGRTLGHAPEPPWMAEARRVVGKHERTHNRTLRDWLRSDGHALGDPARLPWCGDFVETCVRLALPTEPVPDNPYGARNWMTFGRECGQVVGAVAVFWRGSRSGWQGHVGFVAGRGSGRVYVLGGNQSNRVSIVPLSTDRLLGYRWPLGYPLPGTGETPEMVGGALSTNEA